MARLETPIQDCTALCVRQVGGKGGIVIYGPDGRVLNFVTETEVVSDYADARVILTPVEVTAKQFKEFQSHRKTLRIEKV